jgi:hypothetical protein
MCAIQLVDSSHFTEMANLTVLQYSNTLLNAQDPFLEKKRAFGKSAFNRVIAVCVMSCNHTFQTEFIFPPPHDDDDHHHKQQQQIPPPPSNQCCCPPSSSILGTSYSKSSNGATLQSTL